MNFVLWTFVCLIAYIGGLLLLLWVTPQLLTRNYDEGMFMAIAAGDIFGGIFAFGAVAVTFGLFSGNFPIRVLDFLLLVGIVVVAARLSYRSFRTYKARTVRSSRIAAGIYGLLLVLAAIYYIILLFTPIR